MADMGDGLWDLEVEAFGRFHAYARRLLPQWLYNRTLYYHWRWQYRRRQVSTHG